MALLAIRGMTAPKPMEPLPTSIMGLANREARMGGITNHAHNIKEVI
jgi:hypothetical protein